jgi:hypothetical protein
MVLCHPLERRNGALTPDNVSALTSEVGRLDAEIRARLTLSSLLHACLERRRDTVRRLP